MKCNCLCHILPTKKPSQCICCVICPECKQRIKTDKIKQHAKECSRFNLLKRKRIIACMEAYLKTLIWLKDCPHTLPPRTLPPIKSAIVKVNNE